jgi:hypothetical protein
LGLEFTVFVCLLLELGVGRVFPEAAQRLTSIFRDLDLSGCDGGVVLFQRAAVAGGPAVAPGERGSRGPGG